MFSTPAGRIVRAESDARVGGAFLYSDLRDGEEVLHTGRYVELEPARRIVIAFSVPKHSGEENTVEIGIVPAGTGCAVTLSHREVSAQWLEGTRGTWAAILAKADSVVG